METIEKKTIVKNRYTIESWVCDWGIYDSCSSKFVGKPIGSYYEALLVLQWFENYLTDMNMETIEIKTLERIERKYTNMIIEMYTFIRKVSPSLQDEENLDLYIIEFEKEFKNYIKLKKYQNGVL